MSIPPILATGGYNDSFLKFISNLFDSQVLKCSDQLRYVIKSIDFINKTSNDCFFKLIGPVNTKINSAGKIDKNMKPNKHYFSLKESLYPYLLVNVRSGSSYTIVDSSDSYRRVPGSSIGGSFFVGVLRYLNLYTDPTVMIASAA